MRHDKKYGSITNRFDVYEDNPCGIVLIFARSRKIWIFDKIYDFKDIMECSVQHGRVLVHVNDSSSPEFFINCFDKKQLLEITSALNSIIRQNEESRENYC